MSRRPSGAFIDADDRHHRLAASAREPVAAAAGAKGVSKWTVTLLLGVALPLFAISIYLNVGDPGAMAPATSAASDAKAGNTPPAQSVAPMVEQLAARLKKNPNDARGWHTLARSYGATGRFRESAEAYAKVAALVPNNPQLLADYAYILAIANGQNLNGKPMALLQAALKLDPRHQRSLALAGTAAFNDREYAAAIVYWERLQKTFPTESENARKVAARIAEAHAAAAATALAANNPVRGNVVR